MNVIVFIISIPKRFHYTRNMMKFRIPKLIGRGFLVALLSWYPASRLVAAGQESRTTGKSLSPGAWAADALVARPNSGQPAADVLGSEDIWGNPTFIGGLTNGGPTARSVW